ncbi:MAG: ArsR family transcriptional regulator [Promethearchaeota archaeon]
MTNENVKSMPKKNYLNIVDVFNSKARAKIIEVLALYNELNISEIIKKTSLNHSCVKEHLRYLESINFVQEKQFGRVKIYRFRDENINARALKKLIELWSVE